MGLKIIPDPIGRLGGGRGGLSVMGSGSTPTIYVATTGDDTTGTGTQAAPYLTIAKAVSVAPTSGAIISIADGTYALTDAVAANKAKLQFVGASRAGTIITVADTKVGFAVTADDVQFKTLTIDGRRASGGTGSSAIAITDGDRIVIDDCLLKNTISQVVVISGSDDGEVKNCTISNLATTKATAGAFLAGVQIMGTSSRWKVHDNIITGTSQGIGFWYSATYCEAYNNTLIDNYGYADAGHTIPRSAIEIYPETAVGGWHHVHHNTVNGSTLHCIEIAQGDTNSLYEYNTLSNWTTSPVVIVDGGDTQKTQNAVFDHNTMTGNGSNGQASIGGRNTTYSNNTHISMDTVASARAIDLYGTTSAVALNVTVTGNTFTSCRGAIVIISGAHSITYNTFTNMVTTAPLILIQDSLPCDISHNTATIGTGTPVGITIDAGAGGHTISYNNFSLYYHCLKIAVGGCDVHHNTFYTSHEPGGESTITMTGASCANNNVHDNTVSAGVNYYRIYLDAATHENIVQYNYIQPTYVAYLKNDGTNNVVTPNYVYP